MMNGGKANYLRALDSCDHVPGVLSVLGALNLRMLLKRDEKDTQMREKERSKIIT